MLPPVDEGDPVVSAVLAVIFFVLVLVGAIHKLATFF